jgi:hypothetical protein
MVRTTGPDPEELTMTWLLYNIPLMVLFDPGYQHAA